MPRSLIPATPGQSSAYQKKLQILVAQLGEIGFALPGSVGTVMARCGKPACRCHRDPALRYGPYTLWTRKVGKTPILPRCVDQMKQVLGLVAVVIAVYSYVPYFRNIWRGKTKPHAFSWLVWGILTGIGFAAQLTNDGYGGPGAWVTGLTTLVCFAIFVTALTRSDKQIARIDWMFLTAAFVAVIPWAVSQDALLSVAMITVIDAFGFAPTFRKAYWRPTEETAQTFTLSGLKFCFSLSAPANFTLVTALYSASLVLANWVFVTMLLVRRRTLAHVSA